MVEKPNAKSGVEVGRIRTLVGDELLERSLKGHVRVSLTRLASLPARGHEGAGRERSVECVRIPFENGHLGVVVRNPGRRGSRGEVVWGPRPQPNEFTLSRSG